MENRKRLVELESISTEAGFWNDPERAQKALRERNEKKKKMDLIQDLAGIEEDIELHRELIKEGEDLALELTELLRKYFELIEDSELKIMLAGKYDNGAALLTIHPGAGGTESQDWASMLYRMYCRYCEKLKFKVRVLDYQDGEEAGIKSVTLGVEGDYAYGFLKAESGVHRLVRISPFDANKRRHTSFCSVHVIPEIENDDDVDIDDKDLRIDTYRASGAGGQHINTTDSAIRITHIPTKVVVQCQNERSQHKNKASAMKVLRSRLAVLQRAQQKQELEDSSAEKKDIAWGSQIRSYVMHPYQMVKDHRTNEETGNVDRVMEGSLQSFIRAYLLKESTIGSES